MRSTTELVFRECRANPNGEVQGDLDRPVSDRFQRQGLGTEILRGLLRVARDEKLARVTADILPENRAMQGVCEKLGFRLTNSAAERLVKAVVDVK